MKTILAYGQKVLAKKSGRIGRDDASVFKAAVCAMRDGYELAAYRRATTSNGLTVIVSRNNRSV